MILAWLNGREAAEIGAALADEFAPRTESAVTRGSPQSSAPGSIEQLLRRADSEVRPLQLNFYQKAKFANSFKWRLIENGVAREIADGVTQSLVLHLSQSQAPAPNQDPVDAPANPPDKAKAQQLFHRGNKSIAQGAYAEAAALYEEAVEIDSSHAEALNNLGSSLSHLGRYDEAEQCFRQSMAIKPNYADPHGNLGVLLRQKSDLVGAEASLRRALKLKPNYTRCEDQPRIDSHIPRSPARCQGMLCKGAEDRPSQCPRLVRDGANRHIGGPIRRGRGDLQARYRTRSQDAECLGGAGGHPQDDECRRRVVRERGGDRDQRVSTHWKRRICALPWANIATTSTILRGLSRISSAATSY